MSRVLPILFNTEMVRAILREENPKTTTRRVIKPPYVVQGDENDKKTLVAVRTAPKGSYLYRQMGEMPYPDSPYKIGNILYVRETWCRGSLDHNDEQYYYKADENKFPCQWRPSIHMPREAARIWLRVTDVRVERLQDMKTNDFLAEGVMIRPEAFNDPQNAYGQAKKMFVAIWNPTIRKEDMKKYGWEANPWVWVIKFERCEKPEP